MYKPDIKMKEIIEKIVLILPSIRIKLQSKYIKNEGFSLVEFSD
jgi:hypothetical protein